MTQESRLAYLKRYRSGGREYTYYRRDGQAVPIRGEPDTPEWLDDYSRIQRSFEAPARDGSGTLKALIKLYKLSPEFAQLAPRTRADYDGLLVVLEEICGHCRVTTLKRHNAYDLRDKFALTPRKANHLVATLRLLMNFAVKRGWRPDNPLLNWDGRLEQGPGWRAWTDDEVERFLDASTPHMRLAFALGLYTGQREADCLAMTWTQIDGAYIEVAQQKTGVNLSIPIHKNLRAALDAAPRTAVTILTTSTGISWTQGHFKKEFRTESERAGLKGLTYHGLRKTAARVLAELGCSEKQIAAITGHKTTSMVSHYTREADQKRLATAAIEIWERAETGTEVSKNSGESV